MSIGEIVSLILAGVSLGAVVFALMQIRSLKKRLKTIFDGETIQDVDALLEHYSTTFIRIDKEISLLQSTLKAHDQRIAHSPAKLGLKRFNPFRDMGGDMSFVLAILDEKNTGVLITSIVMREGTRMYAKSVTKGTVKSSLSDEEREVLENTIISTPTT